MEYFKRDTQKSLLLILSLLCIPFSLIIIAKTPPTIGYELSIYDAYKWYLWAALSIPLILQFFIIYDENNRLRIFIALFAATMSLFVLLSLPFFRGYPFYGAGDIHTHLGIIRDLANNGNIGLRNVYPASHILIYTFSIIFRCSVEQVSLFIPQIFALIYIFSVYLFSKCINNRYNEALLAMSLAIIPINQFWLTAEYIMPSTIAFSLIPLTLFLVIKSRTSKNQLAYSFILVPFLLLYPFMHPETVFYLLVSLFSLFFIFRYSKCINKNIYFPSISRPGLEFPLLILFVSFIFWFLSTHQFESTLEAIYESWILGITPTATPVVVLASGFKIDLIEALYRIIRAYGPAIICISFGVIISIHILKKILLQENVYFGELILVILFNIFILISIIFLSTGIMIGFHIYRQLKYPIFIVIILISPYLKVSLNIDNLVKKRKYIYILSIVLLIICPIICVYGTYSTPSFYKYNFQPTETDINGMEFFFNYRNVSYPILETGERAYQNRYADYLLGYDLYKPSVRWGYSDQVSPPDHFGIDLDLRLGMFYEMNQYLLIYQPSTYIYTKLYPNNKELWKFSPVDFENLNFDATSYNVYNNKQFKIFLIQSAS